MARFLPAESKPWKKRVKVDWLPMDLIAKRRGIITSLRKWATCASFCAPARMAVKKTSAKSATGMALALLR